MNCAGGWPAFFFVLDGGSRRLGCLYSKYFFSTMKNHFRDMGENYAEKPGRFCVPGECRRF